MEKSMIPEGRVRFGLSKAYRGWGIPGHLYNREGEILESGQELCFRLPEKVLKEYFKHAEKVTIPAIQSEEGGICYLFFQVGDGLAVLGPAASRKISPEDQKRYLFRRFHIRNNFQIPYVKIQRMASCLSSVSALLTGEYCEEEDILWLTDKNGSEVRTGLIRDLYQIADSMEEQENYPVMNWLDQVEKGEIVEPGDIDPAEIYEQLYQAGIRTERADMKQAEYMVAAAVALAGQAAVRGGADPCRVRKVSVLVLQKLSECRELSEMGELEMDVICIFSALVRRHQNHDRKNPYCEKIKIYIARHIRGKIRMIDIAKGVGLSPNYLTALFRREEGISVKQYIMQEKLAVSENLLKNTEASVGDIAEYLTFSSQSCFSSHFRERYGMTPTEYRRRYKQIDA